MCDRLAILDDGARNAGFYASTKVAANAPFIAQTNSVLVVLVSRPDVHVSFLHTCDAAALVASLLRSSQTFVAFDLAVLALPGARACAGIPKFDGITSTRDYVVFVNAAATDGRIPFADLHATALEKMIVSAIARHADIVTIRPSSLAHPSNKSLVCIIPPHDARGQSTCHSVGAPVLMRVPVWLKQVQLDAWSNAVARRAQHALDGAPSSDAIASLWCAGRRDIHRHSLRDQEQLAPFAGGPLARGIAADLEGAIVFNRSRACSDPEIAGHADWTTIARAYDTSQTGGDAEAGQLPDAGPRALTISRLSDQVCATCYDSRTRPNATPGFMIIAPWLEHGGADQFNVNLARALTALGVHVVVVTTLSSLNPTASDFYKITPDVFHLPHMIASPRDADAVVGVFTHLVVSRNVQVVMLSHSALAYDFVVRFRAASSFAAARRDDLAHVKFVDYVHLEEMEWGNGGYAEMSVKHSSELDHTFAASHHVASWMRARRNQTTGVSNTRSRRRLSSHDRISVAYIGVDTDALRPMPEPARAAMRSELVGAHQAKLPLIAYVARMVDQKLPALYFEIMRQLAEERKCEFASLAIGGGPRLAEMRVNISQHVVLKHTIRTLGMLGHSATVRALAASDILLLPSGNEGVSLAVYEAMALGVTPVVSAVGGQCELVTAGVGACVQLQVGEPGSYVDLTQNQKLLSAAAKPFVDKLEARIRSREMLHRQRAAARLKVEQEFSMMATLRELREGLC